jgi:hypothetical protein
MDEKILLELKIQTDLLKELNMNMAGLRADMKSMSKEGVEKGMKDVMAQVLSAFKGTPMEGIMASMMAKAGGGNG